MKTDSELKRDVAAELSWDPAINATAIGVAVKDGVVTLSGHLDTFGEKFAVERALRRVEGVKTIAMELDVKLAPEHKRSDTEIAAAADAMLAWISNVPADKVRVTVEHGWVRLSGEVDWDYQRKAIELQLRPLVGVVGLTNEIMLKHRLTPGDLSARIEGALERQAHREARRIEVGVDAGTVTLRGQAHSWQERDAIVGAAWSAPGVRCVINEVQIAS
jgi:osmotically-inducible protein OsmY